uniref:Uncharacterized protein n=1 Tax=viral metagenome TaxID=1070528 RepID=A0A6C0E7Y4_9ZZZZ
MVSKNKKKNHSKKHTKKQKGSGITHDLTKTVGGLMERVGYSECCPPVYNNNQMVMENGQPMCGGSRKTKKRRYTKKVSKKPRPKHGSGKGGKEYLLTIM